MRSFEQRISELDSPSLDTVNNLLGELRLCLIIIANHKNDDVDIKKVSNRGDEICQILMYTLDYETVDDLCNGLLEPNKEVFDYD